jgi:hypothetical protein
LARAAEPEERNSQNQLFHPGYLREPRKTLACIFGDSSIMS